MQGMSGISAERIHGVKGGIQTNVPHFICIAVKAHLDATNFFDAPHEVFNALFERVHHFDAYFCRQFIFEFEEHNMFHHTLSD